MPTAARSTALTERHLASPALRSIMRRRAGELGGLALGLAGLALLVSLASYDPADPSLNTATAHHTSNLAGPAGALVSDLLLQGFGLAALLPGLVMLAWAWRLASHRELGGVVARLIAAVLALPVLGAVLAGIGALHGPVVNWPAAGLGGAIGTIVSRAVLEAGRGVLGPVGIVFVWVLAVPLAMTLVLLSLGLSAGEWRGAARVVSGAASATGRSCFRLASAFGAANRLFRRGVRSGAGPAIEPDAPTTDETRKEPRVIRPASPAASSAPAAEAPAIPAPAHITRPKGPVQGRRSGAAASRQQEALPLGDGEWRLPPLSLLTPAPARAGSGPTEDALEANARLLETVLSDYGVQGHIVEIRPGPVVTLYELEPAPGIRSARVIGLADDVARSLSVTAVRIATVPGRNVIGIEVPNASARPSI